MDDVILVAVLLLILGAAGWYLYKAKKSGKKCIGCPGGCACSQNGGCSDCCGCGHEKK